MPACGLPARAAAVYACAAMRPEPAKHPSTAPRLAFPRLWRAIGWACVALVVYLSLTPDPLPPAELGDLDVAHAAAYAWLAFWFAQLRRRGVPWIATAAALCALGIGLEVLQGWTGYRTFSYADMRDDVLGVAAGLALAATPLGAILPAVDARLARMRGTLQR